MKTRLILLCALVLITAGVFTFVMSKNQISPALPQNQMPLPTEHIKIGDTALQVEVASTEAAREQGLSGRAPLLPGSGMLFVFDQPGTYGFWMKDMNFPLDIIFADANGTIVTIDQNLSPDSYNSQDPNSSQVFSPTSPAQYVLEVPAGYAKKQGITVGSQIVFSR